MDIARRSSQKPVGSLWDQCNNNTQIWGLVGCSEATVTVCRWFLLLHPQQRSQSGAVKCVISQLTEVIMSCHVAVDDRRFLS